MESGKPFPNTMTKRILAHSFDMALYLSFGFSWNQQPRCKKNVDVFIVDNPCNLVGRIGTLSTTFLSWEKAREEKLVTNPRRNNLVSIPPFLRP